MVAKCTNAKTTQKGGLSIEFIPILIEYRNKMAGHKFNYVFNHNATLNEFLRVHQHFGLEIIRMVQYNDDKTSVI